MDRDVPGVPRRTPSDPGRAVRASHGLSATSPVDQEPGYGRVAKALHWATVLALVAQFTIGYSIERADDLLEWVVDAWMGGEDDLLVVLHAAIGVVILVLAIVRLVWRRIAGLPPWSPALSATERRVAHHTERVLYATLFLIPLTGVALLFLAGEDWDLTGGEWQAPLELVDDDVALGAHIATHVTFFVALAVHLGLVLKHQVVHRDGLLRRML
ncbi:MAG: cytochrome b/b6 domain-containing protein [Trueperaceae bacterium]|nr:cytochrome b/b6 domain-containing protein [Trueperaceae bacterium]